MATPLRCRLRGRARKRRYVPDCPGPAPGRVADCARGCPMGRVGHPMARARPRLGAWTAAAPGAAPGSWPWGLGLPRPAGSPAGAVRLETCPTGRGCLPGHAAQGLPGPDRLHHGNAAWAHPPAPRGADRWHGSGRQADHGPSPCRAVRPHRSPPVGGPCLRYPSSRGGSGILFSGSHLLGW